MIQPPIYIFLYLAFTAICLTTAVAFYDVVDHRCSESAPCETVPTSSNSTSSNSKIVKDLSMFLYASTNDMNSSYPVVEYFEDETMMESSSERQLPSFLRQEPLQTYTNHFIMVKYYKPYCKACKYAKETYIKSALYMQFMFMKDERPPDSQNTINSKQNSKSLFRAYAISCQAYPHLCTTDIHMYPSIRMYDMNTGNTIELDYRRMHPYSIMERMGFDDTIIHTNIYQLSKHIGQQQQQTGKVKKFNLEQLAYNDKMKQVIEEIDYTYNHMKQSDLEQDLHVTVDTMLRQYTYVPNNVNTTTKRSLRDPPLKTASAQTLRIFLELLLRVISPIKNSHLQRFHSMIKELSTSFMYISKHAGYLPVILDEFRIQPRYASKRKNDNSWSHYSKDCAPYQPMIIITPNDDDSPNSNDHNHDSAKSNDESLESSSAPYQCGLWKLLFHMIVGGGFTNYNAVATSDIDKIPDVDMVTMVRDYATNIGFGIWSDHEIQILYNTTYCNETGIGSNQDSESSEMRLALWLGTVRNEIQRHRTMQENGTEEDLFYAQFPSINDCPKCWNFEPRRSTGSYTRSYNKCQYDRPALWNDLVVYKYIQLEYGTAPDNIEDLVRLYVDVHPEEFGNNQHDEL
jgi:hypothetical protein